MEPVKVNAFSRAGIVYDVVIMLNILIQNGCIAMKNSMDLQTEYNTLLFNVGLIFIVWLLTDFVAIYLFLMLI